MKCFFIWRNCAKCHRPHVCEKPDKHGGEHRDLYGCTAAPVAPSIPEEPKSPIGVSLQFEGPAGGTGHPLIDQGRDARKSKGREPDASGAVGLPPRGEQQDSRPAGPSIPVETAASQKEVESLRAEVREWLCESCRTVYPGPPQKGVMCVICPTCGGLTGTRASVELRAARAEVLRLTKERDELRARLIGAYRQAKPPTDHACAQCAPHSEILVPGFVCWWHTGEALAASPSSTHGDGGHVPGEGPADCELCHGSPTQEKK